LDRAARILFLRKFEEEETMALTSLRARAHQPLSAVCARTVADDRL
jgi:hypothetical protein